MVTSQNAMETLLQLVIDIAQVMNNTPMTTYGLFWKEVFRNQVDSDLTIAASDCHRENDRK